MKARRATPSCRSRGNSRCARRSDPRVGSDPRPTREDQANPRSASARRGFDLARDAAPGPRRPGYCPPGSRRCADTGAGDEVPHADGSAALGVPTLRRATLRPECQSTAPVPTIPIRCTSTIPGRVPMLVGTLTTGTRLMALITVSAPTTNTPVIPSRCSARNSGARCCSPSRRSSGRR